MIDVQPQAERVSVLMVDDRPENLLALKAILRGNDYRLVEAESGYEALGRVRDQDFAVILLDVMMPCMSGIEFAAELRRGLHNRDTPIIFLTAMVADTQLIHDAYAAGAVDFLVKPLDPILVQAKVAAFAELYRHKTHHRKTGRSFSCGC